MANFELSYLYLLPNEGNYVNDPNDKGGETYRGISRNNFPNWDGWKIIDSIVDKSKLPSNDSLSDSVKRFYKIQFWRYDGINNQDLADKIFDETVNMGTSKLIKLLQASLRYVSGANISLDGQYGPQTENLVNSVDAGNLLRELKAQIALYYCNLNDKNYLLGWLRRATR